MHGGSERLTPLELVQVQPRVTCHTPPEADLAALDNGAETKDLSQMGKTQYPRNCHISPAFYRAKIHGNHRVKLVHVEATTTCNSSLQSGQRAEHFDTYTTPL